MCQIVASMNIDAPLHDKMFRRIGSRSPVEEADNFFFIFLAEIFKNVSLFHLLFKATSGIKLFSNFSKVDTFSNNFLKNGSHFKIFGNYGK